MVGNEINIIAGRMYAAKAGLARKVREWPGLRNLKYDFQIASHTGNLAQVKVWAEWDVGGVHQSIGRDDECVIPVVAYEKTGPDAVLGKAERKLLARIYAKLCGSMIDEGEVGDGRVRAVEVEDVTEPGPDRASRAREAVLATAAEPAGPPATTPVAEAQAAGRAASQAVAQAQANPSAETEAAMKAATKEARAAARAAVPTKVKTGKQAAKPQAEPATETPKPAAKPAPKAAKAAKPAPKPAPEAPKPAAEAAAPVPADPANYILTYGPLKGRTVDALYKGSPSSITRIAENKTGKFPAADVAACKAYLEAHSV
jgi:hypothetical protein